MKRFTPLTPLFVLLLIAACAPGPQEPPMQEPLAPLGERAQELPSTEAPVAPAGPPAGPVVTQLEPPEAPEDAPEVTTPAVPDAPETTPEDASEDAPETSAEASAETPAAPQGTIAISADGQTFSSGDQEPVTVSAGESFTLQLEFSDPDGVSEIQVELRNSAEAGVLPTGPFTVISSDCEQQLASIPTEVSCTLEVAVAPDAQPIAEEGEFAYAFRPNATDSLGNSTLAFSWGYLIVEPL